MVGRARVATGLPGIDEAPWYRKKTTVELVSSVPPVIAAGIAAANFFQTRATFWLGWLSLASLVWLLIAATVKINIARDDDKKAEPREAHDGLRAALHVLHATAAHACGFKPDDEKSKLRVTFHRVVPPLEDSRTIEQIIDYIGRQEDGKGGGKGRKFCIRSGISGQAARNRTFYFGSRLNADPATYRKDLKEKWSYTVSDAKNISTEAMSWMSIPVLDKSGEHALGVVYLDSAEMNSFDEKARQEAILEACSGLVNYIGERYHNHG